MARWTPPPNWPVPPPGWVPPEGWQPDPHWGPAPAGWQFWGSEPPSRGSPAPSAGRRASVPGVRSTAFVVTMLLVFFPVGLALMWRRTAWRKPVKWTVTAVAALFVLAVAVSPASPSPPSPSPPSAAQPDAVKVATQTARPEASRGTPPTAATATGENDESGPAVAVDTRGVKPASVAAGAQATCRPDPLAGVYHPNRLQVLSKCSTVSGQVTSVRHEADGDVHFDLALGPAYTSMLVAGNTSQQHGWLVVELVPADEPGCVTGQAPRAAEGSYNYGTCTGANLHAPTVSQHVWVTGPYVIDTVHGWAEIHPAWSIATTAPTAPAAAAAPPASASRPAPTKPTPAVVAAPPPAPPQPTTKDTCGAASNPYGYTFCQGGSLITSPNSAVCNYFNCIANFWNGHGYMTECADHTFSMSGGRTGACSHHGGQARPVYG